MNEKTPTTKRDFLTLLAKAKIRIAKLQEANPSFGLLMELKQQLDFVEQAIVDGKKPSSNDTSRINIGLLALRELQDSDTELAEWLMDLDYLFKRWEQLT